MKLPWQSKKITTYILLSAFLLFLCTVIINRFYQNSKFTIKESEISYKFPPPEKSTLPLEIELLKKELSKKQDNLSRAVTEAQLAQLYVSEAKRSGSENFYTEAQILAESSLKALPKNRNAILALSKILSARHEFAAALKLLDEVGGPRSPETSALRAINLMALSRFAEALEEINILTSAAPGLGSVTLKALVLGHLGQDDLAHYYFKRAIKLEDTGEESQSVITRGQFATFLIKKGNYPSAILLCDAALGIKPDNNYVKLVKAQALNGQKKYKQAYELLSSAFAESKEPAYLLNMVISLRLLGRDEDFKILSSEAVKIFLEDVSRNRYGHLLDLAALYYLREEFDKSSETILQDQQNRQNVRGNLMLAKIHIMQKRPNEARILLEREIAKGATEPELFYLMESLQTGDAAKNLKDLYAARAKQANPDFNPDSLFKIP